jgi:lipid-binding SYLF domain-containing protein
MPTRVLLAAAVLLTLVVGVGPAPAASRRAIEAAAAAGLRDLYASTPAAKALGSRAAGILVFPNIVKGGFLFGGQYGEGALFRGGNAVACYTTLAASYGFQAGLQKFGYALFFMKPSALEYLDRSGGWELGTGPSLTILDEGKAASFSTTTLRSDVYAFFFDQRGLMGGIGIQGSKITRITPDP